jgi:hypothetical protein
VLYSVGPDGLDDGGKVIDSGPPQDGSAHLRYNSKMDSKGDIVAGKNLW